MSAEHLRALVSKYRNKGIIVDSNLLLLYLVGEYDCSWILKYKRTKQYTIEDFHLLRVFLKRFESILTTPNVLTEVSNLADQLPENIRESFFASFRKQISLFPEEYLPSRDVSGHSHFERFGLTDCAIAQLSQGQYLVLTDDLELANLLGHLKIDVINFNHIRVYYWQ